MADTDTSLYKLVEAILPTLEDVIFGFLKLGHDCNASESIAFTSARCHIKNRKNGEKKHYTLKFKELFKTGWELLKDIESKKSQEERDTSITKLKNFLEERGKVLCTVISLY